MLPECVLCRQKPCEHAPVGTLAVCDYSVAYYKKSDDDILKHRERVNARDIVTNLRHELHRVLAYIVQEAEEIDPNVSTKRINLDSPGSRIVGATIILDNFIQMITGAYAFQPDRGHSPHNSGQPLYIAETITRLIETYSMIKNRRRAHSLSCDINVPTTAYTRILPTTIEGIIAVLCDNIWKYSVNGSHVEIGYLHKSSGLASIYFQNAGPAVPRPDLIFDKGYKADKNSEGFGFGLYWAQNLVAFHNEGTRRTIEQLELRYEHTPINESHSTHKFILDNLAIQEEK